MQIPARLAAFAAGLAVIGGGAAALGSATHATPPFQSCLSAAPDARVMPGDAMGSDAPMAEAVSGADGTQSKLAGVSLRPIAQRFAAGRTASWQFTITDCEGNVIRKFERDQTKLLHLIVAR